MSDGLLLLAWNATFVDGEGACLSTSLPRRSMRQPILYRPKDIVLRYVYSRTIIKCERVKNYVTQNMVIT